MAKQTTLFPEYVEKYFGEVVGKVTEKYNDEKKKQELLYKTMLKSEYSADLTWGSTDVNHVIVAADVVSTDSSLPLKKRGKLGSASGKLPKLGLKFRMNETEIDDLKVMKLKGTNMATIVAKFLNDVPRVIEGVDARLEIMLEQALSTGQMLVEGDDTNATGVRVTFYQDNNQFKARVADWNNPDTATPQDDIQQMFDRASEDGNSIGLVMLSKKYFNLFRKSRQGKELAANFQNRTFTKNTVLPIASRSLFMEALEDEYGAKFQVVDSTFRVQKLDGSELTVRPWAEANVVALPSEKVGRLVYGTVAEETNPVAGVAYQKSGNFLLISKYSNNDPLEEFTAGQAKVLPVIDGADGIYLLLANEVGDDALTAGDDELEFTKAKETKTTTITYLGNKDNLTVNASEDFVTATLKDNVLSVTCAANSSTARTATVTVTDGINSVEIAVSQAANA